MVQINIQNSQKMISMEEYLKKRQEINSAKEGYFPKDGYCQMEWNVAAAMAELNI
ncbi:MAG: hypothetical protein IAA25_01025 [Candidatus Ruminococcus intestinipullorum]|nr:hypothetical protein [Candidatus Ruminococcus intestinipullorum]